MFKRLAVALPLACALAAAAGAQRLTEKPWTDWSRQEVQKVLDDSAWGQTQTETDTSEMFFSPTTQSQGRTSPKREAMTGGEVSDNRLGTGRATDGALNQATSIKFHIRWLSAKPIRQAMAREIALQQGGKVTDALRAFVESPSDKRVVLAVTFASSDQRFSSKVMQEFNSAVTATLKNSAYLERRDGKRVFLHEYFSPQQNALGAAMFVFPRTVGEGPLLRPDSGEVRFFAEFSKTLKLDMKFKVSDMIYDGRLEY